jgi:diguanylate cyclase (GGDEF)-like protein/hemerythrin-like metal-binding protein
LIESFMSFPAPLVLADLKAIPRLVNAQFSAHYGAATLDSASLLNAPTGNEAVVNLHGGAADGITAHVWVIRTPHWILLVFKGFLDAASDGQITWLRDRVTELERLADTDHLTGAWNRAHLDRVIDVELARSVATQQPLSLVLFDIDHFKRINDTFGHAVGDSVLRELVDRVRARLRSADVLFRWGGEEFVVLVSSGGYRNAASVAKNLRVVVEERPFETAGSVTISLGVAEHVDNETAKEWFERLDAALYTAKESGRNRVVVDERGNSDVWVAASGALHLKWQEGYESGNATIDAEHRELFQLANTLIDNAMRSESEPAAFHVALDTLLTHITRHFADEEAILASYHYGELEQHKRAHAGLLRRAGELKARIKRGEAGLGAIVEYLAQDVVARHMMAVDRAFFPLFSSLERAAPAGEEFPFYALPS